MDGGSIERRYPNTELSEIMHDEVENVKAAEWLRWPIETRQTSPTCQTRPTIMLLTSHSSTSRR